MLLLKTESYRKGVIYSSLFNVTGKSVAFIQQWLIGYYFGMGTASDVFFFTYNIILFLSYFFLNMTTSVLIPEGMKIRNQESDEASRSFFNGFILIYVIIALFVTGVSLFDIQTFFSVVSSFPEEIVGSSEYGILPFVENISQICIPAFPVNPASIRCRIDFHEIIQIDFIGIVVLRIVEIQFIRHLVCEKSGSVPGFLIR